VTGWRGAGWRTAAGACASLLALTGCGHPASKAECEEIFARSAELAVVAEGVQDPEEVKRQVEKARAEKGDSLIPDCVGKRITEDAMQCVRKAATVEEFEGCLD
jgi:hypothetical protein